MKYQFEYRLTEQDYLNFNEFHIFNNSSASKKQILFVRIILPIILGFVLLSRVPGTDFSYFGDRLGFYIAASIILIFVLIFTLGFKRLMRSSIKKSVKKLKKDGKLPYPENVLMQFNEDSIACTEDETEFKCKYDILEKVLTDNNFVYIYRGAMQAFIIPFSAFESERQRTDFLEFINSKIPRGDKK